MWRWLRIMWLCVSSTFVLDSETPIFGKHFNVTPTIVSKFLWKVKSVILQLLKEYSYFYKFQIALFYFNLEWCLEVETSPNNVQFKPSPSPSVTNIVLKWFHAQYFSSLPPSFDRAHLCWVSLNVVFWKLNVNTAWSHKEGKWGLLGLFMIMTVWPYCSDVNLLKRGGIDLLEVEAIMEDLVVVYQEWTGSNPPLVFEYDALKVINLSINGVKLFLIFVTLLMAFSLWAILLIPPVFIMPLMREQEGQDLEICYSNNILLIICDEEI